MLLNAKATLNETMDYKASTCELQPQTLLVCLSSMPVLQQEAEPPVKKYFHIEIFLFFLLIIIFAKLLSYSRAEKKQEYTLKKKKRHSAYWLCHRTVLLIHAESCCSRSQGRDLSRKGKPLKMRAAAAQNKH